MKFKILIKLYKSNICAEFQLVFIKIMFFIDKNVKNPKKTQNSTQNTQVDYKKTVITIDNFFFAFVRIFG